MKRSELKIALTRTENPVKHQYYLDWLKENGHVEVSSLSHSDANLLELNHCDALVLSGGRDIHPNFYGSNSLNYLGAPENYDQGRDNFEIAAFQLAQDRDIPVLGICRGLQLINVICKGTLVQDLREDQQVPTHIGNPDKLHAVNIQPDSLLYDIIGQRQGKVNSAHHQAIDILGEGLRINCQADDGTIEGIEWQERSGKSFLLAIQWHPERMFKFQLGNADLSMKIRDRFIEEIYKKK
jgi:putative glutamine amidotransferase